MFLIDVARFKESVIPLALFDSGKKIGLDFIFITAEKLNYSDPGVIRVYNVLFLYSLIFMPLYSITI